VLDVGRVQCREDFEALLGALVVSSRQLLGQVKGHLLVGIIFEWVGGPMAEGLIPSGPQRVAT
jgi:hypothetical protein